MKIPDWHNRYQLQARWTINLRRFIVDKLNASPGQTVLDVGAGTGALNDDFKNHGLKPYSLELDIDRTAYAKSIYSDVPAVNGDGYRLPFKDRSFDFTFCHYFFLWLKDPQKVVKEMIRVTKKGGYVIAAAEPDYQSRIDFPDLFKSIGQMQNLSLEFQGVNLSMGRQLGWMFRNAGLNTVQLGLLAGQWKRPILDEFNAEWDMVAYDLGGMAPLHRILEIKDEAMTSWLKGEATIFIPTFYAHGKV